MDHKQLAVNLFNETWDLLDKADRTKEEDLLMIHKAHTSLYHWLQIGTPLNFQRGEWMVSHVYAVLGMQESALEHAKICMHYTEANSIDDFDLTFAYEALARSYGISEVDKALIYLDKAFASLEQIKDSKDMEYAKSQLEELQTLLNQKDKLKTYIYILRLVDRLDSDDKWTETDNQSVEEHFLRLKQDFESGKVIHIGRTINPYEEGFGVVIYKAANDLEAEQYMLDDPAIKNGQMTATFKEYKVVLI